MYPEESVQAAIDAKAKQVMAVHWAGFTLAQHHWKDPITRFMVSAKQNNLPTASPAIGELFSMEALPTREWWNDYK
ncbi:MAG: hypothetical protein RIA63_05795 [Cyclobacteriaceae bacterium]